MSFAEAPFGAGPLGEGGGDSVARLYYVIGPSTGWTDPTADEVRAGTLAGGATATASANELAPTTTQTFSFDAVTLADGTYRVAFVWALGSGESNVAVSGPYTIGSTSPVGGGSGKPRRAEYDEDDRIVAQNRQAVQALLAIVMALDELEEA